MMEKRNKTLAFTLLVLVAGCVIIFMLQGNNTASVDAYVFKVNDLDKIDQVVLEKAGEKTNLQFADGRWRINDNFDADRNLIKVLFATIDQAVAKREITGPGHDSIAHAIATSGTKITLLQAGTVRRSFVAGGNQQKSQAYFLDKDGKVYLMAIPGYRVYVSGIFEAGEGMFRDKRVFNFNWRNFKDLIAHFPAQPVDDFRMTLKQNFFGIEGIERVDTTKVNDYLDAVSLLQASEFVSGKAVHQYDSLLSQPPGFEITVADISGRSYVLKVWPPLPGASSIVGANADNEVMLFDRNGISALARKRAFFIAR